MTEFLRIRGREVVAGDLERIRGWLGLHPEWSRRRLSEELARYWDWRTPTGQLKDIATRNLLNRLAARGLIGLPAGTDAALPGALVGSHALMSTPERLQELEQLGLPGQWAVEHIVCLTVENVQLKGQLEQAQGLIKKQDEQLEALQRQAHRLRINHRGRLVRTLPVRGQLGPGWWLWVFTTQVMTYYVVVQSRAAGVAEPTLPEFW